MALEQKLSLKMAQKLVMTPSLQQAIKLLQMTRMELQGVLTQELVENPVLEEGLDAEDPVEEPNEQEEAESDDPMDDIDLEAYFNDYYEGSSHPSMAENKEAPPLENTLTHDPDLYDHLLWQLHMDPDVGARQRRLAELIIGNLNPDGFLVASPQEILALAVGSALPSAEQELDPEEIAQLAAAFELGSNGTGAAGPEHREEEAAGEETVVAEPSLATREITLEAGAELVRAEDSEADPQASREGGVDDPELPEAIAAFADSLVEAAGEGDEVLLDCTLEEVEAALALVRSFEPTGIACRDLQESLLLQLDARAQEELGLGLEELTVTPEDGDGEEAVEDPAEDWPEVETYRQAQEVIAEHWKGFMKRQYPGIAKALRIDLQDLRPAVDLIKGLDPHPGRRYSNERPQYIEPDVSVIKLGSEYVVQVSDDGMPRLRVSRAYRKMLQEMRQAGRHGDAQSFIKDKIRSALWLIKSLDQRQRTIDKVARSIVRQQQEFLERGIEHLRPMVLRDVAEDIDMHESTVSRVVANKYIHTPRGLLPMKFFFHSGIDRDYGENISSLTVKRHIERMIGEEDPKKPLSDSEIMRRLKREGTQIARRTVAKYRDELGIPSSTDRKKIF